MIKLLVCGGRHIMNREAVVAVLEEIKPPPILVITGGALGVDTIAYNWASLAGIPTAVFQPAWEAHGRAAGPMRNAAMIKFGQPDLVLAFPGGAGTADCVKRARRAGIEVKEVLL